MLTSYGLRDGRLTRLALPALSPDDVVWIDLMPLGGQHHIFMTVR
jgi:hypothetical protein